MGAAAQPVTDEDTIKAVTAKLTGEFYVGQRVRLFNRDNSLGVITRLEDPDSEFPDSILVLVDLPLGKPHTWGYHRQVLRPL